VNPLQVCVIPSRETENFLIQWITRVLPLGVSQPLVPNSRRGSDSMDSAQHAHTFPRRVAGNDVYVCLYKHIFRLHPQHMCRRSCHSHHSIYAKLFWHAFRHFSFSSFISSVHTLDSNFQLYTTIFSFIYYAFYLFYLFSLLYALNSSFLSVLFTWKHKHNTKIRSLNTSQLFLNSCL
jgi:hypothetical protein